MKKKITKRVESVVEIELDAADVRAAISLYLPMGAKPESVSVRFRVPTGGDWSGTLVDISAENPILVTVVTKEQE